MTDLFASALHLDRAAVKALKISDAYSYTGWCTACLLTRVQTGRSAAIFRAGSPMPTQGGDFHGRKILIVSGQTSGCKG